MKSQKLGNIAELVVVLFGVLLLSDQGARQVVGVMAAASTLPFTTYGAGELAGQLVHAACPLLIGVSLAAIAYRRGFFHRVRASGI